MNFLVVNKFPNCILDKSKTKEYNNFINDKTQTEATDRRSKNNNKEIPIHQHLNTEKENLDLDKMQAIYMKNSSSRYFADNLRQFSF